MLEFAEAAHDPQTCPTCIKVNQATSSEVTGEIPLADGPTPTGSVTGSLSNTTNSGTNATAINTLMLGNKWDIADPDTETLTYSYFNGRFIRLRKVIMVLQEDCQLRALHQQLIT